MNNSRALLLRTSFVVLLGLAVLVLPAECWQTNRPTDGAERPFAVADAIRMTKVSGTAFAALNPKRGFATFSPDGRLFAIVLRRGNIEQNTNDYSLLLFRTAEVFHNPRATVLASFSSSSNRPGISDLSWLNDNDTLVFLAAHGAKLTQLYAVHCRSGELHRLTTHPTSIISYAVSRNGDTIVYAAEKPERSLATNTVSRNGLHVSREAVTDLLRGRTSGNSPDLFVKNGFRGQARQLHTFDQASFPLNSAMLSPDGRFLVIKTNMSRVPTNWSQYQDPTIQQIFRRTLVEGFPSGMLHFELIDTKTGTSEILLNSPTTYEVSDVLWSPHSRSLLLSRVFLPLDISDEKEAESRRRNKFVVEVRLPDRRITKITNQDLVPLHWDASTNVVRFDSRDFVNGGGAGSEQVYYRETAAGWERLSRAIPFSSQRMLEIDAEQDLNIPPRVVAIDPKTKRKVRLIDLNPSFAKLRLGKVQKIDWDGDDGTRVGGGIYLPPDYVAGVKYPLVIQTHGFNDQTFVADGPHMTASAAQPLANRGFIVLQLQDVLPERLGTSKELEGAMQEYEGAIDYLDRRRMIDRERVGIAGFSRTCMYVKYALTHSTHHFAAAVVSDGADAGYVQYLLFYNVDPLPAAEFDSVIGAAPFGSGLTRWLEKSPGFRLDKVQTPLLIQALGTDSVLTEWEWFSGLKRLNKPVDLVFLPTGSHVLIKPWDRLVSQQGVVDWFCFWLKGEEDPNPRKAKQYALWRKLRTQVKQ